MNNLLTTNVILWAYTPVSAISKTVVYEQVSDIGDIQSNSKRNSEINNRGNVVTIEFEWPKTVRSAHVPLISTFHSMN